MMFDAIIVGAGPGGTTAATCMADSGLRVLLLEKDRFPRDKICGDAISGKAIQLLRTLGIEDRVQQVSGKGSWGITFGSPSGEAVSVPFTGYDESVLSPAFVCERTTFDNLLFERTIESGAEIWQGTAVGDLLWDDGRVVGVRLAQHHEGDQTSTSTSGRALRSRHTTEVFAPLIIGADGAYSSVVRGLGLPQLEDRYYGAAIRAYYEGVTGFHEHHFMEIHFVDVCTPGYFWIFPLGGGRANVGVGMLSRKIKKHGVRLKDVLERCLSHPQFRDRFEGARRLGPVKGWGLPLGSRPRPMAGNGWLLVGDAASLIDPFTGEGIGNAMISGEIAARWAKDATAARRFDAAFLAGYQTGVLSDLGSELRISHALQRIAGVKWLLNFVIRKAARSPHVADAISCMFSDEEEREKLLKPSFYFRLLAS